MNTNPHTITTTAHNDIVQYILKHQNNLNYDCLIAHMIRATGDKRPSFHDLAQIIITIMEHKSS